MKTDVRYIPKRAEGTAPIQVTKQIHLPPGYYTNLKEAWIAIAYEIEKQHMSSGGGPWLKVNTPCWKNVLMADIFEQLNKSF